VGCERRGSESGESARAGEGERLGERKVPMLESERARRGWAKMQPLTELGET